MYQHCCLRIAELTKKKCVWKIIKFIVIVVLEREILLPEIFCAIKFLYQLSNISQFSGKLDSFCIDVKTMVLPLDLRTVKILFCDAD